MECILCSDSSTYISCHSDLVRILLPYDVQLGFYFIFPLIWICFLVLKTADLLCNLLNFLLSMTKVDEWSTFKSDPIRRVDKGYW